jgi:flagellar basal-body rod modification protein FlgD
MTQIANVNTPNLPVLPNGTAQRQLNQTDFLRLMTTQLREQDPFNPVDNQAMVAQMAQFSSVAGISEMNASLRGIADQISEQTRLLGEMRVASNPVPTP